MSSRDAGDRGCASWPVLPREAASGGSHDQPPVRQRSLLLLFFLALVFLTLFARAARRRPSTAACAAPSRTPPARVLPGCQRHDHEHRTQDVRYGRHRSGWRLRKERLLPGPTRSRRSCRASSRRSCRTWSVSVDTQTNARLQARARRGQRERRGHGREPAAQDRPCRCRRRRSISKQITELPVLDRNFTKFILLTPGTQQQAGSTRRARTRRARTQIQVERADFSGTGYQLDGTENRDPILGIIVINPNLESIGETKITSQNYDAEFGQATAGVVSVQTKSGRTRSTAAPSSSTRATRSSRAIRSRSRRPTRSRGSSCPTRRGTSSAARVGGPIVQNKWFFFGDYQGTRATQGGSRLLTVPTAPRATATSAPTACNIYDPLQRRDPAAARSSPATSSRPPAVAAGAQRSWR